MKTIPVRPGSACLCKFLLLEDGTLLFGFFSMHFLLWEAYCRSTGKPENIGERPPLAGAGNVWNEGRVSSWESIGFDVETPHALRPAVQEYFATETELLCEMYREAGG